MKETIIERVRERDIERGRERARKRKGGRERNSNNIISIDFNLQVSYYQFLFGNIVKKQNVIMIF